MNSKQYTFFEIGMKGMNRTIHIEQRFNDHGKHCLVYHDFDKSVFSDFVTYRDIAHLAVPNVGQWYGTSEYYEDRLPRVFQAVKSLEDCNIK